MRPSDVIVTRSGLTVEVGNTDAEGRLILCDALAEADTEQPMLMIDCATLPFRGPSQEHFLDHLRQRLRVTFDGPGQRIAAERSEANRALHRGFVFLQRKALVVDHQEEPVALHGWPWRGEVAPPPAPSIPPC